MNFFFLDEWFWEGEYWKLNYFSDNEIFNYNKNMFVMVIIYIGMIYREKSYIWKIYFEFFVILNVRGRIDEIIVLYIFLFLRNVDGNFWKYLF